MSLKQQADGVMQALRTIPAHRHGDVLARLVGYVEGGSKSPHTRLAAGGVLAHIACAIRAEQEIELQFGHAKGGVRNAESGPPGQSQIANHKSKIP